jgi:hypothetical protein
MHISRAIAFLWILAVIRSLAAQLHCPSHLLDESLLVVVSTAQQLADLQVRAAGDQIGTAVVVANQKEFARWLHVHLSERQRRRLRHVYTHEPGALGKLLWPVIKAYLAAHHGAEVAQSHAHLQLANMAKPHTWYPLAAGMRRRVVYHAGPTNSGKTFSALQARACWPPRLHRLMHDRGHSILLVTVAVSAKPEVRKAHPRPGWRLACRRSSQQSLECTVGLCAFWLWR